MNKTSLIKLLFRITFPAIFGLMLVVAASAASVSLSSAPTSQTVVAGQSAAYTIKLLRDGYADKVTLSATGLPAGATATFSPNTTTAASSTLTIATTPATPSGTFAVNVKAVANGITIAPIVVSLTVTAAAPSISVTSIPDSQSIIAGQSTTYDLVINRTGFTGAVKFSVVNLPAGFDVAFEPATTTGNTTRMRLYSNGLPHFAQSYELSVVAERQGFSLPRSVKPVKVRINCDMVWADQGYAGNGMLPDFATAVASDNYGNVYVAGHFISLPSNILSVWVVKYDASSGAMLWRQTIPVPGFDGFSKEVRAIGFDNPAMVSSANPPNIYVAGFTRTPNTRIEEYDAFIAKFNPNGTHVQTRTYGSNATDEGRNGMDLRFDSAGRVVLTAVTDVDKNTIRDQNGVQFDNFDFRIRRLTFDSSLALISDQVLIPETFGDPRDLWVSGDGSVFVAGRDNTRISPLSYFGWVKKYSSTGASQFSANLPNPNATAVAADSGGGVYVGGTDNSEAWLARLSPQFVFQWSRSLSTPQDDEFGDLAVDAGGNAIYAGSTQGSLSGQNPDGQWDGWLAKRSSTGNLVFVRQFAVANKDQLRAISLDNAGNALLAGNTVWFKNPVAFGYEDALIIKYSLNATPFLAPFVTTNPTSVRSGQQFVIEGGNFFDVQGVFFNGQALQIVSSTLNRITVVAPNVPSATPGNITVSSNCHQVNSPTALTVAP